MFSPEDQSAILNYIFHDESNLELALGVLAVRERIAERVIKEFLTHLENELRSGTEKLGDSWEVKNELSRAPFERWKLVYLSKREWRGLYRIGLGAEKWGANDFILGVSNNCDVLSPRFDEGKIREALEGKVQSGNTSNNWPFWISAEGYKNWVDEATLSLFVGERGRKAASELSGRLLAIANAAEKVIDMVAKKWWDQRPSV